MFSDIYEENQKKQELERQQKAKAALFLDSFKTMMH